MQEFPRVSVIMLNYNGLADTLSCLESLKRCSYPNFDVILLDNGSQPEQVEQLARLNMERVRFVDNKENLGFAGGNNVGIRMVLYEGKSQYIFFLNNDTTVEPDFLDHAVACAQQDGRIGVVATLSLQYDRRALIENAGHWLLDCGDSTPRGRNLPKEAMQERCDVLGACAANALYRVEAIRQVGMFDEAFFLNYEDADLALRTILYGWRCVYEPKSIIYHKVSVSIKKVRNYEFNVRSQFNQIKSYYHNIPSLVMAMNLPFILLRDLMVVVTNTIFFKWTIVQIFIHSRLRFLRHFWKATQERRKRMRHQKVSSMYILKLQKSFLPSYFDYFREIILRRNKSVLEMNQPTKPAA